MTVFMKSYFFEKHIKVNDNGKYQGKKSSLQRLKKNVLFGSVVTKSFMHFFKDRFDEHADVNIQNIIVLRSALIQTISTT